MTSSHWNLVHYNISDIKDGSNALASTTAVMTDEIYYSNITRYVFSMRKLMSYTYWDLSFLSGNRFVEPANFDQVILLDKRTVPKIPKKEALKFQSKILYVI